MDDAGTMRPVERVADLDRDLQRIGDGNRTRAREPIGERFPFEIFEEEEVDAILMAHVEPGAVVGMLQRRDSTRFTVEALAQLRIGGELRWQDLDRDRPIEPRVARAVDLAHAAGSERRDDLVWPETNAGRDVHGCR